MQALKQLNKLLATAAILMASTAATYAQTIAYSDGIQAGNQNYGDSLGNDFTVNSPIVVTSLGAFAGNGAAGFTGTITVGIFNATTLALVAGPLTFSGNTVAGAGTFNNGDWFKPLSPAVLLPAGSYSVVAVGFSAADLNGNSTLAGYTPATQNTGGGLITFSANGRYDTTSPGALLLPATTGAFQFLAGTFQFQQSALAPTFTKAFSPSAISLGQTSTLTLTITNPNTFALTGVGFTDPLPAGMTAIAATTTCGGVAAAGPPVSLTSGIVSAGGSCTVTAVVKATAAGSLVNTTSTLTSNEAPAGAPATAILTVRPLVLDPGFQTRYSANLNLGESFVNITNTGANGAALVGPGFGPQVGSICVNVYAFDSAEELIACCSCLVTPDQTVNLGVARDLTSKTLTGVIPTSATVKLLATLAGTDQNGNFTCTNTAATATTASIVNSGMAAWGTTLHAARPSGVATTETAFTPSTLSAGELASITGRCAFIIGNGSGFGICSSCRAGALGAERSQ